MLLALSARPGTYLERAALLERAGSRQAARLAGVRQQLRSLAGVRAEAGRRLAEVRSAQAKLRAHKRTIEGKLAEARRLLATLDPAQRAAVLADGGGAGRASRDAARTAVKAPSSRAARAVAFAYEALGRPYAWGATGPGAFDCSGLTQAAWKSAGVSLPRTTFTQVNAGSRVSRSQLAPGDLVFFYPGLSHVGLYIGGGRMIHAPHPGAPVRVAPVDLMPFSAAVRPA
jgi:peptidoglycan DL-endopeptidase CwlO